MRGEVMLAAAWVVLPVLLLVATFVFDAYVWGAVGEDLHTVSWVLRRWAGEYPMVTWGVGLILGLAVGHLIG